MSLNFCPYCGEDIEGLYNEFVDKGYQENFNSDCPKCGKTFNADVYSVPDFVLTKKETEKENA